ncbi:MAG: M4 family metallopeptidase, partial [Actinomycetota bacterium]|nr:M4 family metallopeptidase [Actinomycetota bacterium]
MQRKLRLGALVLLGVLLVSGFHPTVAQTRGRGRLIASYRADSGQAPPARARPVIDRGRGHVLQRHAGAELAVVTADVDDLDVRHVRFDQRYHGLPVFGGQLIAQLNQAGDLQREFGHFYAGIALATQATLAPAQALARAEQALGYTGRFATPPTADLLILPAKTPASYTLAYHVTLKIEDGTPATAHHEYFVDAHSGAIVRHFDSLPHDAGTGHSLYSGDVPLNTERLSNGTYNLRDGSRGSMETRDAGNGDALFNDADNSWGTGTNADRQSAAADVQFGAAQTWDYYLNTYGRQGIDGSGYQVVSHVHYGTNYDNAFWDGSAMYYGDGDGATFSPLVALDVAGHEITHGLTEKTAGLIYQDESGAANESFSDIFGTAVEWYTGTVGGHAPDYWIGEDIYTPGTAGDALRYMDDPGKAGDPDHYTKRYTGSSDNGGVHTNSGIQNNAFYLLAEGGTNKTSNRSVTGVGRAKAEAIFFRALTVKLTPSATFMDVRNACLAAASDLYGAGSPEYTATRAAWAAVGVDANQAPTAIAGGPYNVAEGGSVVLTGSGSDPDGDPLVYAWDLDNNGTFETAGQNATFSAATLDGPSSATVRLQVCDDNLACDTTSATVTITNVAPQLSNLQVTPAATSEHALATLSGDIVDPGTQDTQTVVIRWGDGSTNTTVSLGAGATSFTTQHPYLDDNPTGTPSDSYAISVSVTD